MIGIIWAEAKDNEGNPHAIGFECKIPWHIPEDLAHFKKVTKNYPVIMGRKTYESLRKKPLAGRENIVITSGYFDEVTLAKNFSDAMAKAEKSSDFAWVIGGHSVYCEALLHASVAIVTEVFLHVNCDTYAPKLGIDWVITSNTKVLTSKMGVQYRIVKYKKATDEL
jgi:dihydrofolate reductase